MTLEQARNLIVLERINCLSAEQVVKDCSPTQMFGLVKAIEGLLTNKPKHGKFIKLVNKIDLPSLNYISLLAFLKHNERCLKNNILVERLSGSGSVNKPYTIKTKFGTGRFFKANEIFKNYQTPDFIKKDFCHYNSFMLCQAIAKAGDKATVLGGIACLGRPFLHSVVCINYYGEKFVLDFNYNLAMSYNLYVKLFSFNILSELDGERLIDDCNKIFQKCPQGMDLEPYYFIMAHHDFMRKLEENKLDDYLDFSAKFYQLL